MTLFVEIVYVLVTVILILVVLLQAGRGGGLGTALGGGASQSVFGGSGGADFLAKLTQGLAAAFMICAVYLAYESAHHGSDRLKAASDELAGDEFLADANEEVNYERVGPNPLPLPPADATPGAAPRNVQPPQEDEEAAAPAPGAPALEEAADGEDAQEGAEPVPADEAEPDASPDETP